MGSWLFSATYFSRSSRFFLSGFMNGGGPTLIYGYIFCFVGSMAMCASISELASMSVSGHLMHCTFSG